MKVNNRKRVANAFTERGHSKKKYVKTSAKPVKNTARKAFLDKMHQKITVDKEDKKVSKTVVHCILKDMLQNVCTQEGGHIYKEIYVEAGSHPIKAKIGKADEFDVHIPLNIDPVVVRLTGSVYYKCLENQSDPFRYRLVHGYFLYCVPRLMKSFLGTAIPTGYAVIEVEDNVPEIVTLLYKGYGDLASVRNMSDIPLKFRHGRHRYVGLSLFREPINQSRQSGNIDLIPLDVKEDLYEKLSAANDHTGVEISQVSHGPAITFTISADFYPDLEHDISVDITASVKCDIPLTTLDRLQRRHLAKDWWKKRFLREFILSRRKILFWAVSFSKAERILLSGVDGDYGCRKYVLKLLKKYVSICQSRSENGLPGISTHIIKTQVLWSCEQHADSPEYWQKKNRDVCVINTMRELEQTLRLGRQKDFFNTNIDILGGKDQNELTELADFLHSKWQRLMAM